MSDFLKGLMSKAKAWVWDEKSEVPPPVEKTEEHAVRHDLIDHLTWQSMTNSTPKLRSAIERVTEQHESAPPAFEDLFNLLYQGAPSWRSREEMRPEFGANHDLLQKLSETDEFAALHRDTRNDEYSTTFAMLALEKELSEAFEKVADARQREQQAAEQAQQAQQGLQDAMARAQAAADGQGGDPYDTEKRLEAAVQAMEQGQGALEDAQADTEAAGDVSGLGNAAAKAGKDLSDERKAMAGWGQGPGDLQHLSFDERRAVAERLNGPELKALSEILGTWRPAAATDRTRKLQHPPAVSYEYEMGNDLTRMVFSEYLNLGVPELEEQMWIRHAKHALLLKKPKNEEKAGKGPIILVCDESSSMGESLGPYTRELWSKALAVCLADQARQGKRDFTYIGFASGGEIVRIDFPGGSTPVDKIIELATHFFNGGTSYEGPLALAMEITKQYAKAGDARPDIIFATDDECRVSGAFVEEFKQARFATEARCYGIQIGGGSGYDNAMHLLTDQCISIDKLNPGPDAVSDLFRNI